MKALQKILGVQVIGRIINLGQRLKENLLLGLVWVMQKLLSLMKNKLRIGWVPLLILKVGVVLGLLFLKQRILKRWLLMVDRVGFVFVTLVLTSLCCCVLIRLETLGVTLTLTLGRMLVYVAEMESSFLKLNVVK